MPGPDPMPFDALLLLSFGGPEKQEDVVPFLRNVTRGRGIPDERLAQVGEHYYGFGGRSPINDQNRALLAAIEKDFAENDLDLSVYWGNRNWDPYLKDTLARMATDGIRRAAVFVTSAYSSYSGCRQYREDLAGAAAGVEGGAPALDRLRAYFNHPGFLDPMVDSTLAALEGLPAEERVHLLFVTHSVPVTYDLTSGPDGHAYVTQHESVRSEIIDALESRTGRSYTHDLVFCSRSGAPGTAWLEPDINDRLTELATLGVRSVGAIPIGFVSDHMEVVYDLDVEAARTAADLGLAFTRASTCGTDRRFVALVRDLLLERAAVERGETVHRAACGSLPAAWDLCLETCCPNPRAPRPAIGEVRAHG